MKIPVTVAIGLLPYLVHHHLVASGPATSEESFREFLQKMHPKVAVWMTAWNSSLYKYLFFPNGNINLSDLQIYLNVLNLFFLIMKMGSIYFPSDLVCLPQMIWCTVTTENYWTKWREPIKTITKTPLAQTIHI